MADVVFVMVCLIKILPSLQLEWLAGVWIAAIAILRMVNIIFGYVYRHQLILLHTIANKVTGTDDFNIYRDPVLLPLCMQIIDIHDAVIFVCIVATFAAIQEGHYIRTRQYNKEEVESRKER